MPIVSQPQHLTDNGGQLTRGHFEQYRRLRIELDVMLVLQHRHRLQPIANLFDFRMMGLRCLDAEAIQGILHGLGWNAAQRLNGDSPLLIERNAHGARLTPTGTWALVTANRRASRLGKWKIMI